MRKILSLTVLVGVMGCASYAEPQSEAVSAPTARELAPMELRTWVDARGGTGETVHWVSEGGVFDYPSGEKLFGMIGFDSSKVIWPDEPGGKITHLTRKTFAYTDAETGEVLTEYNGKPVTPIAYPYQMITYRFENGRIYGDVEQGVGDKVRQIKSTDGMRTRMMGEDTMAVTASVFLDFPTPNGGRYEAWENYDFFLHTDEDIDEPHQMSWQRYGAVPPFAGEGKAIYHLLSWRVESQEEFPEQLLAWAKENKPGWLIPPQSVEEVRQLQSGEAGVGWAR